MNPLSVSASDEELVRFIDGWAALLEREDYLSAFRYTDHDPATNWTPELIREVISSTEKEIPARQ